MTLSSLCSSKVQSEFEAMSNSNSAIPFHECRISVLCVLEALSHLGVVALLWDEEC